MIMWKIDPAELPDFHYPKLLIHRANKSIFAYAENDESCVVINRGNSVFKVGEDVSEFRKEFVDFHGTLQLSNER